MITYGSVCSGIESASVAWEPLGMAATWFSEIEAFPSAGLGHHWPQVPNLGDMCQLPALIRAGLVPAPDALVGGTPCQAFSVAGLRGGMDDARGQLTLTYVDILNAIDEQRPGREAACVWENVPGVLSSKDNAFGCFLAALCGEDEELRPPGKKWTNAGAVFGPQRAVAWRILDAQYFGVAQRRRRVFVVASARDGFDPTKVLFESEGVRRDSPPSREKGEEVAGTLAARTSAGGFPGTDEACSGYVQAVETFGGNRTSGPLEVAAALNANRGCHNPGDFEAGNLIVHPPSPVATLDASFGRLQGCSGQDLSHGHTHLVVHCTQDPCVSKELVLPLGRNNGAENAVFAFQTRIARNGRGNMGDICHALSAQAGTTGKGDSAPCVATSSTVRRLTPIECERLQGFPDNHTQIPWRNKPAEDCPDGPRYKAIGNSKAVPVIKWVGERLLKELQS